jgi:hypothetical protein
MIFLKLIQIFYKFYFIILLLNSGKLQLYSISKMVQIVFLAKVIIYFIIIL